jgi:hypothetical protein
MKELKAAYGWVLGLHKEKYPEHQCASRDIFRARIDRFYRELLKTKWSDEQCALISAIVGEVGNNCFDHNLGQWKDDPGCWFDYEISRSMVCIVIADRGQGVLSSLQRVDPGLGTDQEALETAFSKVISGRSPEKRGNGLKFVRQVINGHPARGMVFLSGNGKMNIGALSHKADTLLATLRKDNAKVPGTFALILGGKA